MPTPCGKPRAGEVWRLQIKLPDVPVRPPRFLRVVSRSRGEHYSIHAYDERDMLKLYTEARFWIEQGWLTYVGQDHPH